MLYLANTNENADKDTEHLRAIEEFAKADGAECLAMSNAFEAEISQLAEGERVEFLESMGLELTALERFVQKSFSLLKLQVYFTAGVQEVRAWACPQGCLAPQAAGIIHSDFEKGFIRAEVIGYEDFVQLGGEANAKKQGKMRLEGKSYVVQDGDIMHFRFAT